MMLVLIHILVTGTGIDSCTGTGVIVVIVLMLVRVLFCPRVCACNAFCAYFFTVISVFVFRSLFVGIAVGGP